MIWEIFSYELNFEGTEIIIAGFDKKHHYGSLYSFNIYFNHNGNLIIRDVESIVNCEEAFIRVYAMNEEAYAFITDVSSDFEEYVKRTLKTVNNNIIQNIEWFLKSKQIKNVHEILEILKNELLIGEINLNRHIENFKLDIIQDTSNCCEYLPRQLLCDFADSLIKLTALKQKLSLDLETVSSESDIALITKTGNLKWIKYTEEII